ncbi:MAG: hypothetical protein ABEI06_07105 [Halobacteriaceae archaeon]
MRPGRNEDSRMVTCIACGSKISREEAREYDKYGDRWDREEKHFEFLCKSCYREIDNTERDEVEELLTAIDAGSLSHSEFIKRYVEEIQRDVDSEN